jgi:hypothetical protein
MLSERCIALIALGFGVCFVIIVTCKCVVISAELQTSQAIAEGKRMEAP